MTTQVTPETLTFENIKSWTPQEMKDQMRRSPEMREAVYRVVKSQSLADIEAAQAVIETRQDAPVVEPTPEELAATAAAETERLAAEQTEAQRVAEEQEAARKAAEPKKFVADYQVKDEDGNPIGRPTHLEAATEEELRGKIIEAHVQATRAFHRLKKQKVSFKDQQPQVVVPAQSSDAELLAFMKDLKSDDPQKQLDAVRKVQKVETDRSKAEADQKIAELNELRRQEQVSYKFLVQHQKDFYNCEANIALIKSYFQDNELAWTSDNLEIAFHALELELAPVESAAPIVPANPAPVAPVVQATPVVVQPVVIAPVPPALPANPVVAAPRPGVNGGIVPGQNSGSRPAATAPQALTAEEIKSWSPQTMRSNMRNPAKRAQIEAFAASRKLGPRA